MTYLARITNQNDGPKRRLEISLDVGRTLTLLILGGLCIAGAVVLWLSDKDTGAAATFTLGEAIVVSGLGVAIGEKSGAREAESRLSGTEGP
jgi:hypothetical protein